MYTLAKVKDIVVGTIQNNGTKEIVFNSLKTEYKHKLCVFDKINNNWYKINNLLFHKDWITDDIVIDERSVIGIIGSSYIMLKYTTDGRYIDLEHGIKIVNSSSMLIRSIGDYVGSNRIVLENAVKYDNDWHCSECGKNYSKTGLAYFGKTTGKRLVNYLSTVALNPTNVHLCHDCVESIGFVTCEECETTVLNKKLFTKEGKYCTSCYSHFTPCSSCGVKQHNRKLKQFENKLYCTKCANEKFDFCEKCGLTLTKQKHAIQRMTEKVNGRMLCSVCSYEARQSRTIHEYSYKPEAVLNGGATIDNLFMGFEFELTVDERRYPRRESVAGMITELCNTDSMGHDQKIYCKSDSSIGYGFELVTHPFNYKYIKDNPKLFQKIFNLKLFGCKAFETNTCGFHVHMSKSAFTSLQMYKFTKFIAENKRFSVLISERSDMSKVDTYCNFEGINNNKELIRAAKSGDWSNFGRHSAVNLNPTNTVEIRIFRGVLEFPRFMKNVEFCVSLYEFTQSASIKELTLNNYLTFVTSNKNKYRNLITFLKDKGEI